MILEENTKEQPQPENVPFSNLFDFLFSFNVVNSYPNYLLIIKYYIESAKIDAISYPPP